MRRLPVAVSIFTVLFFFFSLTGNVLIADPAFTSVAFAQKKKDEDKDDEKNALKGNKRLRAAVGDLQTTTADLQNQISAISLTPAAKGDQGIPGVAGNDGAAGPQGLTGTNGADGAVGATGPAGAKGDTGATGAVGPQGDTGPDGVGDIKVVKVRIDPPFAGTRNYDASSACNGNGMPIEAGLLSNPYVNNDVAALVLSIDSVIPQVTFQITSPTLIGIPNQGPVQFWLKCAVPTIPTAQANLNSTFKTVFLTSARYDGNLGGIAGADAKCQAHADSPSSIVPTGSYKAWISSGTEGDPATNFTKSNLPYLRPDGKIIADDWIGLTNGSLNPDGLIRINEYGELVPTEDGPRTQFSFVWTATDVDGTEAVYGNTSHDCESWTTNVSLTGILFGDATTRKGNWTNTGFGQNCQNALHLYCFQQ